MSILKLGKNKGYMGLKYHMIEAYLENNMSINTVNNNPNFALFSKKYCDEINNLDHNKIHDYCFIGSISSCYNKRRWVIKFAKKYFTTNSIFINTDNNVNWKLLGDFDKSNNNLGFCPKKQKNNQSKLVQYRVVQDNIFYFQTMCQSKFILCPAGDSPWSFRFYEVLMCKSIPIVKTLHHTYRTKEESNLNYKYILANIKNIEEINTFYDNLVIENSNIFKKYHMLYCR